MIDIFLYDIGVYSVQYMLLLLFFFAVNNCHVILMLLTDYDVFIIIELVLLYGLYELCNTFQNNFKGELLAHYANLCVHTAKTVQLNKTNVVHLPKVQEVLFTYCQCCLYPEISVLVIFFGATFS